MTQKTIVSAADLQGGGAGDVDKSVEQALQDLVAGIDRHLSDLEANLARAKEQASLKKLLCQALPSHLPLVPKSIQVQSTAYKADASLYFETENPEQVLDLLDALPGVELLMVNAGSTSFVPQERFVQNDRPVKVTPIAEVVYRFRHWCERPQEEFEWWTHLAGKLVQVVVKTAEGAPTRAQARGHTKVAAARFDEEVETLWDYQNLPGGQVTQWYGGDSRNMAPLSVHQLRGISFREAWAQRQSAQVKTHKAACRC